MLIVQVIFKDGTTRMAEIADRRAYPKRVSLDYGGITVKTFSRRGSEVEAQYDEEDEPVQALLLDKDPDTAEFDKPNGD